MDQACRCVIKCFSCLLGNAVLSGPTHNPWFNLDHTVITAAIRQWRHRLSACLQADGGHFEHHF